MGEAGVGAQGGAAPANTQVRPATVPPCVPRTSESQGDPALLKPPNAGSQGGAAVGEGEERHLGHGQTQVWSRLHYVPPV